MPEHLDLVTALYFGAGLALPLYYVPQIRRFARDDSALSAFSLTKTAVQCLLRLLMLPFVVRVGNDIMTTIVALDTAGRILELVAAIWSLQRQGWAWRDIAFRVVPVWIWNAARYGRAFGISAAGVFAGSRLARPMVKTFRRPRVIQRTGEPWAGSHHASRQMAGSAFSILDSQPVGLDTTGEHKRA